VIADRGYDSDPLRKQFARRGLELIVPHRKGRRKPPTQDGRSLRRYKRRWIVERTFAWLGNYRRLAVRYDRSLTIYRGVLSYRLLHDRITEGFEIACSLFRATS
jgi:transposase